jgi:hypothetical protein
MSRRALLRGAAVGAAATATVVAFGPGTIARAAVPPITIEKVEASNGQDLFVERVTGRNGGELNAWRPTSHVYVRNNGASTIEVNSIGISYQGGSSPSNWWQATPKTINPGSTGIIAVPEPRLLAYPLPDTITLQVVCDGYNQAQSATFPLAHMSHHTPDGTLPFPMRASDCASGVYLATGTNHGFGSAHGNTREQRFAYDFHARRWNGNKLSRVKTGTDGSKPEDYLIWGQPVYAVANAKIVAAWRNRTDDGIGEDTSPGGNGFWMQLTGGDAETATFALYAHLMQGSIPEELVPVEGGPGPNVTKGQFLGLVGKSGTGEPHLHFHIQRGIAKYVSDPADTGEGLPIRFTELEAIGFEHFDAADPDVGWKHAVASGIGENCLVNAEAPEWVGPIETTGMAQEQGGLHSTNWNEPDFLPLDPTPSVRGR